jgi:CHASE2 domain-containing sensor protein/signal transduction histidine kinase
MSKRPQHDLHPYEQHILTIALILITALLVYTQLAKRLDLLTYDAFANATTAALEPDTIIISIDEKSLNSIGQWPWRRAIHAQLIDKLREYKTSLIAFDILFTEPDTLHPDDDAILARAIQRAGNVVLPLHINPLSYDKTLSEILPLPELTNAVRALGHVHVELDEDGLARGIHLNAGVGDNYWSSLSLAMALEVNPMIEYIKQIKDQTGAPYISINSEYRLIPFAGPRGSYPTYSFLDVMANKVPADIFRNKIVLIGATAAGLGDIIPTPFSHLNSPMSGVEIHANAFASIMAQNSIKPVDIRWAYLLTIAFILIPILMFPRLTPTLVMPSTLLLVAAILGFSFVLLAYDRTWFPPINSILGIMLAYPFWSWQRMRHLNRFFKVELERLNKEPDLSFRKLNQHSLEKIFLSLIPLLKPKAYAFIQNDQVLHAYEQEAMPTLTVQDHGVWFHDHECSWIKLEYGPNRFKIGMSWAEHGGRRQVKEFLDKLDLDHSADEKKAHYEQISMRIDQVRSAITAMQDMRIFISRGFEEMPGAVIVTDPIGLIVYANTRATNWLQQSETGLISNSITKVFADISNHNDKLDEAAANCLINGKGQYFEMSLGQRDVMVHSLPFEVDQDSDAGLMISMSDITEIRQKQREKNQLIDFLSHDLRSPLVSQLAMLEGLKSGRIEWNQALIHELSGHAKRSLNLSEQFLQITRAEQAVEEEFYTFEVLNAIENAIDSVDSQARAKNIAIVLKGDDECWMQGNAELVERALINLINNAVKYSDNDRQIKVYLTHTGSVIKIKISDQGYGINKEELPYIFDRFRRQKVSETSGKKGAGLGLNFVKVVIDKHKGDIQVTSELTQGSEFCVSFPEVDEPQ